LDGCFNADFKTVDLGELLAICWVIGEDVDAGE
jgi:hypothetical protein